ncbi:DNA-binding protein HU-beta [Sphingomonas sp. BE138]|nr:DNA-binding protein HU-beta [Sphingomonas sp. BE138]
MALSTADLAAQLSKTHGLDKGDARKVIDAVFAEIVAAVARGEEVSLNGVGKFKLKETAERQGRNPASGEAMTIAAQRKITFAPAKQVRDRLNGA